MSMHPKGLVVSLGIFLLVLTGCSLDSTEQKNQATNQIGSSEPKAIVVIRGHFD